MDDEFSDDFISEMKTKATLEVYFLNDKEISELQRFNEKVNSLLLEVKKEIDTVAVPQTPEQKILGKESIDISRFVNGLVHEGEASLNKLYQVKLNEVLDKHTVSYSNYIKSTSALKEWKKRQILKWTVLVGVVSCIVYLGLRFSNVIKPSTITWDVVIALITTGIGNLIGYTFSMFKIDINKISAKSREEYVRQEKSSLLQMFNEDFWEELSKKISEPRTDINSTFLKNVFNSKIDPILVNITSKNQNVLNSLNCTNNKIVELINDYILKIDFFYGKHSLIFKEAEKNIVKVEQITKHIKETAIKPSFDLLNETAVNLENVYMKMESLK